MRVGVGVKYGVDSYFGSATQASVKAFQRYKGLPDHRRRRPGDRRRARLGRGCRRAGGRRGRGRHGSLARGRDRATR